MKELLHRSMKTVAALSLAVSCVAGGVAAAAGDAPSTPTAPPQQCFIDGKAYTVGAVIQHQDTHYRCMPVHVGAIESPPTLAWQPNPLRAGADAPPTLTPPQLCFIDSARYTVGAVAKHEGAYYRCMPVHVSAIENPPTLAWQDQPLP